MSKPIKDYRQVIRDRFPNQWFTVKDLADATQHLSELEPPYYDPDKVINAIITFQPPLKRRLPKGAKRPTVLV